MREWVWTLLGGRELDATFREQLLVLLLFGVVLGIGYYTNENWLPAAPVGVLVLPLFMMAVAIIDDRLGHLFPQLSDGVQAVLGIGGATLIGYFDVPERAAGALGVSDPVFNGFVLGLLVGFILLFVIRIGLSVRRSGLVPGRGGRLTR